MLAEIGVDLERLDVEPLEEGDAMPSDAERLGLEDAEPPIEEECVTSDAEEPPTKGG